MVAVAFPVVSRRMLSSPDPAQRVRVVAGAVLPVRPRGDRELRGHRDLQLEIAGPVRPALVQDRGALADVDLPVVALLVRVAVAIAGARGAGRRAAVARRLRETVARAVAVEVTPLALARAAHAPARAEMRHPDGIGLRRREVARPRDERRPAHRVDHALLARALAVELAGLALVRAVRAHARLRLAARTLERRRRRERPRAVDPLPAAQLAGRVLGRAAPGVVGHVVLQRAVVDQVGLALVLAASPLQSTVPLPGPFCWKHTAPKLGTSTGGMITFGTATCPSW